ncbi:MAG: aspartate/glutamate racemase family protein [Chitinophagaceae bacterium]
MKTIGIIGGLSWVSTVDYYRIINEEVNKHLGGVDAAKIILYSLNYGDIVRLTRQDDWKTIAEMFCDAARKLEQAGADCLLLGANTAHRVADEVRTVINIPLIHISEATANAIAAKKLHVVALLGTRFTMEMDFYHDILRRHGIETIIPGDADRDFIHATIYDELGKGLLLPETKQRYLHIIEQLIEKGAQGIILGCTEIPLLIKPEDVTVPVFDTAEIHAKAAVAFALG